MGVCVCLMGAASGLPGAPSAAFNCPVLCTHGLLMTAALQGLQYNTQLDTAAAAACACGAGGGEPGA